MICLSESTSCKAPITFLVISWSLSMHQNCSCPTMALASLNDIISILYDTHVELVLCISRPSNRIRKLLCNLRTLKPRRVNIVVVPPTLDAFILLQRSPSLRIQFGFHQSIDLDGRKHPKGSILQENTCYWGARNPSILQASPPFHVELLPSFISNRHPGITVYHVAVTFGVSLWCLNGWIVEPTTIEAISPDWRTKARIQVWVNGSYFERLRVQFSWRNSGSPVLQSESHLWGVWSSRFLSREGRLSISSGTEQGQDVWYHCPHLWA